MSGFPQSYVPTSGATGDLTARVATATAVVVGNAGPAGTSGLSFQNGEAGSNLYRESASVIRTDGGLRIGAALAHLGTTAGFYAKAPVAQAAAIAAPTAPSIVYVQAEATAMKTAVDAIRVAIANIGITL